MTSPRLRLPGPSWCRTGALALQRLAPRWPAHRPALRAALLSAVLMVIGATFAGTAAHAAAPPVPGAPLRPLAIPDVTVQDQHGRRVQFQRDLVQGQTVAINFIFTSCTTICTPLGATFRAMQDDLARRKVEGVRLISITVDPLHDTPEELLKYGRALGADERWRFVTGSRRAIDSLLATFGVAAGSPGDHSPIVYLLHGPSGRWTRASGLGDPQALVTSLLELRTPPQPASAASAASGDDFAALRRLAAGQAHEATVEQAAGKDGASYFTNLPVLDQQGRRRRFYDDLLRQRVVLVSSFYAGCADVCSPVSFNLAKTQQLLEREGLQQVSLVSISTDADADTPAVLRDYAKRHGAGPGWTFVTGKKENVDWLLFKLGLFAEDRTQHSAALWVGNDRTGAWLKLHALAPPEAIVAALRKIL